MKNLNDNNTLTIVIVLYKEPFELIYKTLNLIKKVLGNILRINRIILLIFKLVFIFGSNPQDFIDIFKS